MNRSPINSVLHRLAEKAIPPAEVDLWPAIQPLFETREAHAKGDSSMKRSFAHHRRLYFVAVPILAVLLVAAVLLITPQGRAWAQSAMRFFTRTESDTIPAPTSEPLVWVEQTPGVPAPPAPTMTPLPPMAPFAADCGDYREPRCSVEQMRSKVDFTVKELATIPAGMYFIGATGGPEEVYIYYERGDQSGGLSLREQSWTGSLEQKSFEVAPGVEVEEVPVGGTTGEYVQGSFGYTAGETEETWMSDNGLETLRWVDQEVFYNLRYFAFDALLGKDEMGALAASLTTEAVSANILPMPATATPEVVNYSSPYTLTIAQAEEQAGFDLWVPGVLPEGLSLEGAHYDPERHTVSLLYRAGPEEPSFSISEQPISSLQDCAICGIEVGDINTQDESYRGPKLVGANATIETVQISEITGLYVEGVWQAIGDTGQWGWEPYPEVAHMRWQQGGMAFALSSYLIDQEDLITIAESMK
jgi:hypothetical protein